MMKADNIMEEKEGFTDCHHMKDEKIRYEILQNDFSLKSQNLELPIKIYAMYADRLKLICS